MTNDEISAEKRCDPMSASGHLQTCPAQDGMSASALKADIRASGQQVN